jgi:UPF0755 protein
MIKKLGIAVLGLCFVFYLLFFVKRNVENDYSLKLNSDTPFFQVKSQLKEEGIITNSYIFDIVNIFYQMEEVPAGHYKIKKSMTTLDILRKLKNGNQDPLRWTISTATFVEEIAGKASQKFAFDSMSFLSQLYDSSSMRSLGYTRETALTLFLPNTYEFYWNTSPRAVLDKMHNEVDKFWTAERKAQAAKIKLSPIQVYILASLVQKEYTRKDERSKIASVLLNRLNIYMPLQVDATCKYATGDFAAKRVNYYHTQYNSSYNTYKVQGLPPGPICMPELSTIDAVLNPERTDYIYYCADPSLNGYHIFSKTLAEHESIASTYHTKMNELKIR